MAAELKNLNDLADRMEALVESPAFGIQDESIRRRLREAGRKLSTILETPGGTIHRISYTVRDPNNT